jgi:hypothetical protein
MDANTLLLLKPLWYLLLFTVAAVAFRRWGPHWRGPAALVVVLATVLRLVAGVPSLLLANAIAVGLGHDMSDAPTLPIALIVLFGFFLWLGVAKVAFRRTPLWLLVVFALLAELASGGVDAALIHDLSHFNIC